MNKEICQKCWKEHGHECSFTWSMGAWPSGEEMFNKGWMECCYDMGNIKHERVLIYESPPKWCKYILEHLMETQKC